MFPFAGRDASVEWEVTGGVSGDGHASVPGSARHMRAIRHWATVATSAAQSAWATLEAPLVQRGDIHLPYRPFPGTVPAGEMTDATIVSWAMNNLWNTNFPSRQGGETTFRYAVAPGDRETALELGTSLAEPLVAIVLAGPATGAKVLQPAVCSSSIAPTSSSFISQLRVMATTWLWCSTPEPTHPLTWTSRSTRFRSSHGM